MIFVLGSNLLHTKYLHVPFCHDCHCLVYLFCMFRDKSMCRALSSWYNEQQLWRKLVRRVMDQDWSWANPALDYIELYYKAFRG